jgi:hypothetical protein
MAGIATMRLVWWEQEMMMNHDGDSRLDTALTTLGYGCYRHLWMVEHSTFIASK